MILRPGKTPAGKEDRGHVRRAALPTEIVLDIYDTVDLAHPRSHPENRRPDRHAQDPHPRLVPERHAERNRHHAHARSHRRPSAVTRKAPTPPSEPEPPKPARYSKLSAARTRQKRDRYACDNDQTRCS